MAVTARLSATIGTAGLLQLWEEGCRTLKSAGPEEELQEMKGPPETELNELEPEPEPEPEPELELECNLEMELALKVFLLLVFSTQTFDLPPWVHMLTVLVRLGRSRCQRRGMLGPGCCS